MDKIKNNPLYLEDINTVLDLPCDWNKLRNKTLLITGATGLIGSALVDMLILLNKKFSLNLKQFLISRHDVKSEDSNIKYINHDINFPFDYSDKIDFIIHLASNTHPKLYSTQPVETITTNIFGTYNLLQLAKKNKDCRFLNISSVEIYGDNSDTNKIDFEESDMGYIDCSKARAGYSEAKRTCETLCQSFKSQFGLDFVTARLCRCYGPTLKVDDSKALSQFIKNCLDDRDIILKSPGHQFYSYLYSSDAATALIFLLLNGISGEAYNVSDKKSEIHLKDLAQLLASMSKRKVIFDLPDEIEKKGFSNANIAILNSAKLTSLGWTPRYNIQQGLERTLKILKGNI